MQLPDKPLVPDFAAVAFIYCEDTDGNVRKAPAALFGIGDIDSYEVLSDGETEVTFSGFTLNSGTLFILNSQVISEGVHFTRDEQTITMNFPLSKGDIIYAKP